MTADRDLVYFMRSVPIRKSAVIGIRPSRDGRATTIVTADKGRVAARRVDDDVETVLFYLYGIVLETPKGKGVRDE